MKAYWRWYHTAVAPPTSVVNVRQGRTDQHGVSQQYRYWVLSSTFTALWLLHQYLTRSYSIFYKLRKNFNHLFWDAWRGFDRLFAAFLFLMLKGGKVEVVLCRLWRGQLLSECLQVGRYLSHDQWHRVLFARCYDP